MNGFTVAASYQILISQLNALLGLKIDRTTLPLALIGVNLLFKKIFDIRINLFQFERI